MAAGNERADELAKEGARDDSFQSILCDTYKGALETCKAIIGYIGSFILRAKRGERWPDVVAPPQGWDEKDERWKRAKPILARPHVLRHTWAGHWFCEVCDKRASWWGCESQTWHTQNVLGILREHWDSTQDHNVTSWLRLAVMCGAAGVEREQPSSPRNLANRVLGIRGLKGTHVVSVWCRVVGIPKRIDILDHRNCSRSKHGQGGGKATKGTTPTWLGYLSSGKQ